MFILIVQGIAMLRGKKVQYVEQLLLHPLVRNNSPLICCPMYRRKSSGFGKGGLFCPRHPYGGHNVGQFNNLGNRQQLDAKWNEDSHYRWPSPSLPPTLKKGATMSNKHQQQQNNITYPKNNGLGSGGMIIGSTHPHHNYENYDTYEMEQQYFKNDGNRMFRKNSKGRGVGGGTLDHRVHPERAAISNNDFNLYAESTKKHNKYLNNNNANSEEILDEFGDVVVVRSKVNSNDNSSRKSNIRNSSLKYMSDTSGWGQMTSTTSAAFNDDSSDEGWTTEF